jgi:hypothetical protein
MLTHAKEGISCQASHRDGGNLAFLLITRTRLFEKRKKNRQLKDKGKIGKTQIRGLKLKLNIVVFQLQR